MRLSILIDGVRKCGVPGGLKRRSGRKESEIVVRFLKC